MGYQFNAYASSVVVDPGGTFIYFEASPDMGLPAGSLIRFHGSSLTYDYLTGVMTGTITSFDVFDADAGAALQTVTVDAANQAALAGSISAFLAEGIGIMNDTFNAWAEIASFDHTANAVFDPSGTFVTLELRDAADVLLGYLKISGTDITDALVSVTGQVTGITLFDTDGTTQLQTIDYTATPHSGSVFQYGILSLGVNDGNDEELYPLLVAGGVTIDKNNAVPTYQDFESGAGNDTFNSATGGGVNYEKATAGVTIDMAAGTSTGGGGSDTWAPDSLGGARGSRFGDVITGSAIFANVLFGDAGDDEITGGSSHDVIDGGDGADTLNGGDGEDRIYAGAGDDEIFGGVDNGIAEDDIPGELAYDDVLTYSRIVTNFNNRANENLDLGQGAENFANGVLVTYTGAGSGTVAGIDAGSDTFSGIEVILGSKNSDTFDASAAGALSVNTFTGMAGSDVFQGGAGVDRVSYDPEVLARSLQNTTITFGVGVNMSSVTQLIGGTNLSSGFAIDMFGTVDTLIDIDEVDGTQWSDGIIGSELANTLIGREGADLLVGRAGNDILWMGAEGDNAGGSAADYVDYKRDGGAGAITVTANGDGTTTVTDTHGDTDTIHGFCNIVGTDLGDSFVGSVNTDRFSGGRGDDTYTSNGGGVVYGGDQISYLFQDDATLGIDFDLERTTAQLVTNDGVSSYWGEDTFIGFTTIWIEGTQNNDLLKGGAGNDVFLASRGVDDIDGRGGDDVLAYFDFRTSLMSLGVIYDADAAVAGKGTVTDGNLNVDTYQRIEALSGSMLDDTFNGASFDEFFIGNAGNDTFNGNGGSDTVSYDFDATLAFGLAINLDELKAQNSSQSAPHGIFADLNTGMAVGTFENLNTSGNEDTDSLVGISNIIGSAYDDSIFGDAGDNELSGGLGEDTLDGRNGADRLDGGDGADEMTGGDGNDTFVVNSTADFVIETNAAAATGGVDTIETYVALSGLAANVENLILFGSVTSGVGNALVNTITGNGLGNTLDGGADSVADTLIGGLGNDIYIIRSAGDAITEAALQGTADRVKSTVSYVLGAGDNIEFLETFAPTATVSLNLTGNELAQTITGNAGINTLDGGATGAADTLVGGLGNDTYIVRRATDAITEAAGQGTADRVKAAVTFVLGVGDNIEFLETFAPTATASLNLTGNEISQTITGNAGINTLDGGAAGALADTFVGGLGNDTYIVRRAGDQITEAVGQGTADRVKAVVSFTLGAGDNIEFLETLTPTGLTAINLTGNEIAQTITGNAGANTIIGAAGIDILNGLGGADRFQFNALTEIGDSIINFEAADFIVLKGSVFGVTAATLATAFVSRATDNNAQDTNDRLIFRQSDDTLWYDSNGSTAGGTKVMVADLSNNFSLTAADILII